MRAGAIRGLMLGLPLSALLWAGIAVAAYQATPPDIRHQARQDLHGVKVSVRQSLRVHQN